MSVSFVSRSLCLAALPLVFVSCAELQTDLANNLKSGAAAIKSAASGQGQQAYWEDTGKGSPKIVANLTEQRAYFYRGKKIVGSSNISTGRKAFETPPGHYNVIQKDEHHVSSEYGDYVSDDGTVVKGNVDSRKDAQPPGTHFSGAKMPYFMRFRSGYGMHAGYVPRFRASHGCIRMPIEMAKHFFDAASEGTAVIVKE
ncbi:MAG: L,D-transpeptidase [Verrucomicrobiota bacterium]|nr:L,D-transpeptidase [Verrucomicrobiota bacterium]